MERDLLMLSPRLMPPWSTLDTVTPTPTDMSPSAPAPVLTPSPRDWTPPLRDMFLTTDMGTTDTTERGEMTKLILENN